MLGMAIALTGSSFMTQGVGWQAAIVIGVVLGAADRRIRRPQRR